MTVKKYDWSKNQLHRILFDRLAELTDQPKWLPIKDLSRPSLLSSQVIVVDVYLFVCLFTNKLTFLWGLNAMPNSTNYSTISVRSESELHSIRGGAIVAMIFWQ